MSFMLDISDMLEALKRVRHPGFEEQKRLAMAVAEVIAEELRRDLGVVVGPAEFDEPAMGGLVVKIAPSRPGQALPEALQGLDDEEGWVDAGGSAVGATAQGRDRVYASGSRFVVWAHRPGGFEVVRLSDGAAVMFEKEAGARLEDELEAGLRAHETRIICSDPIDHVCEGFFDAQERETKT